MSEGGEKTFAPTQKRKEDATKKGDIFRSRDLGTAVSMLAGAIWLALSGPWLISVLSQSMRIGFAWDRNSLNGFSPEAPLLMIFWLATPPVLVLGLSAMAAGIASQLAMGDGRWQPGNIAPKASRFNPITGLKRMFGITGLIEAFKGLAKVLLLGIICWVWASHEIAHLLSLGTGEVETDLAAGWSSLLKLFIALSCGLLLIAMVDVPVQWFRRFLRLRMSQQEMRDEHKESEGSPEKKAAVRNRQRQIAMGGVQSAMREAQFLLTNPTHFSVALVYDAEKAPAPILLAKGKGEKAMAMRELAAEFGVPVLEYPALARSLFYTTQERHIIREELYIAVASVLAFVMSLKRGETAARPEVTLPFALRFDAHGAPETGTGG